MSVYDLQSPGRDPKRGRTDRPGRRLRLSGLARAYNLILLVGLLSLLLVTAPGRASELNLEGPVSADEVGGLRRVPTINDSLPWTSRPDVRCSSKKSDKKSSKDSKKSDKKDSGKKSSKSDKKSKSSKSSSKKDKSDKKSKGKSSKKSSHKDDSRDNDRSSDKDSHKSGDKDKSQNGHSSDTAANSDSAGTEGTKDSGRDSSRDAGRDTRGSKTSASPSVVVRGGFESWQFAELEALSQDALFSVREIGDSDWTPDSRRLVVVTDLSGKPNLWAVDINGVGWPQQLTFSDIPLSWPRVSPDGRSILFQADPTGKGSCDLYVIPITGGTPYNLTNTPTIHEQQASWSPDGRSIVYLSNEDTPDSPQVYLREIQAGKASPKGKRISRTMQSSLRPSWSPTGDKILVSRFRSPRDANLVIIDPKGGDETVLTPHQGEQLWLASGWSSDGKRVLASSNAQGVFQVATVELATRQVTWVTQETEGDALAYSYSPSENRVAWTSNSHGSLQVLTGAPLNNTRGGILRIRKGKVDDARFSPDGRYLAFRYENANRSRDLWIYDLSRQVARQVTFSMVSGLKAEQLVDPVTVHYPSFDGTEVSALLYVPHNLTAESRRPVIVWAHDGPNTQYQNGFDPELQLLANRGYLVLVPNYRGSTGQGSVFEALNDLDWGGGDLHDLAQAVGFLKTVPFADPGRLVIAGRGYGGYLALMALARTPELWAAGVALGAPLELSRSLPQLPPELQQLVKQEMGTVEEHKLLWQDRSVLAFAGNIRAPLLLIYGGSDGTTPASDLQALVDGLKSRGQTVDVKTLPEELRAWGRDARVSRQVRQTLMKTLTQFLEKAVGPRG